MKYSLTHCYTDHNKGDAAIIVATTQLLRKADKDAEISMFSTFGPNDDKFLNEHGFISKFADKVYPGMFYQPQAVIKNSDKSRLIHFSWISLKFLILLLTRNKFVLSLFFTKLERQGISEFMDSDMVISKGGSYITSQNSSVRQCLSLITMLYPFFLAKRYRKKIVIFSQSLGPVVGWFNKWLTTKALSNITKIYLRESVCLERYSEIKALEELVSMDIIPDSAFALDSEDSASNHYVKIDTSNFNVGMTIVDHAFKYISNEETKQAKIAEYKQSIIEGIKFLIETKNAYVHIFPQVISENSHLGHSDVRISREIEKECHKLGFTDKVKYHFDDFNPMQLRNMYGNMDLFIGTRLHSVIFALSQNVPSINIAYHGTKSQGILKLVDGFEENVILIDDITPSLLKAMIAKLDQESDVLREKLINENRRLRADLEIAIDEVISLAK